MKLKKFAKGLLYVIGCIVFVWALTYAVNRLWILRHLTFNPLYMWLTNILFPLAISVVFSFEYIKNLFKQKNQKLTIRISHLVIALFAIVVLCFQFLPFLPLPPSLIMPIISLAWSPFGPAIVYFALWYSLIHAFKRENSDIEGDISDEQTTND